MKPESIEGDVAGTAAAALCQATVITVNGEPSERLGSIAELVATVTQEQRGVAVAVNGEVVPRGEWAARQLADGDAVEILTAAQGG